MNLRQWMSNSSEFLDLLPGVEKSEGCVIKDFGIVWNHTNDVMKI